MRNQLFQVILIFHRSISFDLSETNTVNSNSQLPTCHPQPRRKSIINSYEFFYYKKILIWSHRFTNNYNVFFKHWNPSLIPSRWILILSIDRYYFESFKPLTLILVPLDKISKHNRNTWYCGSYTHPHPHPQFSKQSNMRILSVKPFQIRV
jgi:hypothetical protein